MAAHGTEIATSVDRGGFLPVAVDTLCPTAVLDFDLYLRPDPEAPPSLYRESMYPLEQEDLDRLAERGVQTLYIPSGKCVAYQRYLREVVLANRNLTPVQRFAILKRANRAVFQSAFRSSNLDHMVRFADEFGQQMSEVICNRDLVLVDLFSLMDHDYYTYTHVTNVCTYCVALANWMDGFPSSDLVTIAVGALLHDIGKRHVPPGVLNNPDRLTSRQRELVRQHAQAGFEELCLRDDLCWGQLMMVYQHHERLNGHGYPVGLTSEEIHPWARICSIADVFDALSSERPYRKPDQVDDVLKFLRRRAGNEFDREMVQCWVAMMRGKS